MWKFEEFETTRLASNRYVVIFGDRPPLAEEKISYGKQKLPRQRYDAKAQQNRKVSYSDHFDL